MKARQLIGSASFQPVELKVMFEAFDDAWDEVATDVSSRERCRSDPAEPKPRLCSALQLPARSRGSG
jgi:hypothetical protein